MGARESELLEMIEASDAYVAEHGGSEDPVARREVTMALVRKGAALTELGRRDEAVRAWDDVLARARAPRLRLRVLQLKRSALVGRDPDGLAAVGREIVREFSDDPGTEFREAVADALVGCAWQLLREGRIDEALTLSERLVERLRAEPDESLPEVAGRAIIHARHLAQIATPGLRGVVGSVGLFVLNLAFGRVASLPVPRSVAVRRRRLLQALAVCAAVIDRIGTTEDRELETTVATARVLSASAEMMLGRLRSSAAGFGALSDSHDYGVGQAFHRLADDSGKSDSIVDRIGEVSFLAMRAEALGGGDEEIQRIAYDDSMEARRHRDDPLPLKWLAVLLRPRTKFWERSRR